MSEWKSAFPELNRVELEELCLRQNARVLELLAALKALHDAIDHASDDALLWNIHAEFEAARAVLAKAQP